MCVQRYCRNGQGRDFIVGDLHGCFAALEHLLSAVDFDPSVDRCFSVGDLIDRGPHSERAAQWVTYPWFAGVRGNHEQLALRAQHNDADAVRWLRNGGIWWVYASDRDRVAVLDQLAGLPVAIEVETASGRVGIVHADVPAGYTWDLFTQALEEGDEVVAYDAMWSRVRYDSHDTSDVDGVEAVYVGHTVLDAPLEAGNVRFIDLGAYLGEDGVGKSGTGALCLAELGTDAAYVLPIENGVYGPVRRTAFTVRQSQIECDMPSP